MTKFARIALVLCLMIGCCLAGTVTASVLPAQSQLESTIDQILKILRDETLKGEAQTEKRRQALRKVIYKRFDFTETSRRSLAMHWKKLTPQEQKQFSDLFGKLLENTYVNKIEAYTDEKVEFGKARMNKKKTKIEVQTKIITDSVEIPINYRMHLPGGDQWMVYDMVIEGASLVKFYREQFMPALDSGSFDDLMAKLKEKQLQ